MQFLEANARRVVVKIGTNSITGTGGVFQTDRIDDLCAQISALKQQGFEVLVISSGSIGMGIGRMALAQRPGDLTSLQACAAVGQSRLMEAWQKSLDKQGLTAAQILLTREDVRGRGRHLGRDRSPDSTSALRPTAGSRLPPSPATVCSKAASGALRQLVAVLTRSSSALRLRRW